MAKGLCPPFDAQAYSEGHLTPVYFGSALNNFGVRELLAGVGELAPAPRPQPADPRPISPEEPRVAGFVFKVQANIDPQHRDRIAFVRLASGRFQRGMKLKDIRTGRHMAVQALVFFSPASATSPGGLARRHHRHPQPREPQDRRHPNRRQAGPHHRHPELCAGNLAPGQARRPDELNLASTF